VAVSSPLFQILTADGFIAQIICAISGRGYSLSGFGFVDDVDLCITAPNNDRIMVVEKMQNSLRTWAGLLRATGGALVPDKCFWYYVHSKWENGNWKYAQPSEQDRMQVPDDKGNLITIPQLGPSEAKRTLGVRLAPDGNNIAEEEYLLEVAKQWQKSMATAKVTHSAAEFELRQVILRKLEYPLVATMFNKQQCTNIMKPILSTRLPSAGIIRLFPRALVHGPWRWGGLNDPNLYMEQLVTHLHTILKFGGQLHDMMGNLLQASYKALQLESSLSGNVFNFPECVYEYTTKTWLSHTCEICREAQIRIKGMSKDFLPLCAHDVELM